MRIKDYKLILLAKDHYISQFEKNKLFRKEIIFSNIFLIYILSTMIFKLDTPIFEYIDYIMATALLLSLINMIIKIVGESNTLRNEYKIERLSYLDEKINFTQKFLSSSILVILSIILSVAVMYISNITQYNFSVKLLLFIIISLSIYIIVKIFNKTK
ncbi:hypothetical protein [Xenorhabdus bovienii]|uniref:Uncharacterized protein n=1 Tax=Xenorhabdus bovienii str. feltiae Moldova TaxID=1398200 RepID=A0A077NDR7_XENBV|nr:hypothetical protein [Xenorhabdus bovienii]CDH00347.1 conserved membrane hypothetical protein [Xenorhabdus bovienii str. feltiae Moldova]